MTTFSICIPQYNRTSFLLEALATLQTQSFTDFEVCISDDASTDGRADELLRFLSSSSLKWQYVVQPVSLRYDGNLRATIALARGQYCLLHGNDDCLVDSTALERLQQKLARADLPEVAVCNYQDWTTGAITRRVQDDSTLPGGVETAISSFRNIAFVTGVVFKTSAAQAEATARWDGSEMYQMYLLARIVGAGGRLLQTTDSLVRKDIQIVGDQVDSYRKNTEPEHCSLRERKLPLVLITRLMFDGLQAFIQPSNRTIVVEKLVLQLYLFTYPYWLVEYRRVKSFCFAFGLLRAMRPQRVYGDLDVSLGTQIKLRCAYVCLGTFGLLTPIRVFTFLQPRLYRIAKKVRAAGHRNSTLS